MKPGWVIAGVVAAAVAGLARAGPVELRRGSPELPEGTRVLGVAPEGVAVLMPGPDGITRNAVVGWEHVRSVGGEFAEAARAYADLADKAWRARTRLARGDLIMAEPLLDELFVQVQGQSGPTATAICDGLLRCRAARGAYIGAVEAWLALAGSQARGVAGWGEEDLGAVDRATGLAPSLPPIWVGAASVQVWAAGAPKFPAGARAGALEAIYREAAKFECGMTAALAESPSDDAGVKLAWEVVAARIGGTEQRQTARGLLVARLAGTLPAWQEAWCRVGVGRSMLREDGLDVRRLGVIELLRVPARLSRESPYLAGVALAESAAELKRQGDEAGALRLRQELFAGYPDHPALQWESLRGWTAAPTTAPAAPENDKPPTTEAK